MSNRICCEKHLGPPLEKPNEINLYLEPNATFWRSRGSYGSTVWDEPTANVLLECYICDDCLKAKQHLVCTVILGEYAARDSYVQGIHSELTLDETRKK